MCGFCIEDMYFNGQASGSFFAVRSIRLMEAADWHSCYTALSVGELQVLDASDSQIRRSAAGRALQERPLNVELKRQADCKIGTGDHHSIR